MFKYSRRRLVAAAVAVLAGSCVLSPSALAASPSTADAPVGFWARALASVTRSAAADADPFPAGRIPSLAALDAERATSKPAASKPAAAPSKQPVKAKGAGEPEQANAVSPKRWITGSHYEQTTDIGVLHAQGCGAGESQLNGLVILAFGKPAYNGHTYGTILFSNSFAGNHRITYAMEAFARGYVSCLPDGSTAQITLARGTSNYGIRVPNTVNAGRRWARETMTLAKWLRYHGMDAHVRSAAAIDAEPAWDPSFHRTHAFFQGYRKAATGYLLYNFGSLDGGVGAYWNLRQAFYVAGGMKYARVVPEIYFPQMVHQWAQLARMAQRTYHRPVQFAGVMTQRAPGCGRHVCGMGPREAHNALKHALALVDSTRPLARHLASVTNIN